MIRSIIISCCWLIYAGCAHPARQILPELYVQNYDTALQKTAVGWIYRGQLFNGYLIESGIDGRILYKLPVINGKEEGEATGWYNTGEKLLARHFRNGNKEGRFEQWWPNGKYRYLFNYTNDQLNGQQLVYYPNGQKRLESNYLHGKEEGIQRSWNQQGSLISNYTIKNNKLYGVIRVKSCMPSGHS